ncbi:hypothetical protein DUE52_09140 [Larkinella punicea]|uniref:Uncharacterized protein n=2 Tax=Larkinella punicea TaxID=2315727 RepID=A0A368JUV9_9BACT|nr:hypothetical protein DUE52_09140 [Larkinella punicea]
MPMESLQLSSDINLEMYIEFHKKQFGVDKTADDFVKDAFKAVIREGWIVAADPLSDIHEIRQTGKFEDSFSQNFSSGKRFAALFLANKFLKKVLYFEWKSENVFYCPPGQTIADAAENPNSLGYANYLLTSTPFTYSDDAAQKWVSQSFEPIGEILGQFRIAGTTSTNHSNAPLIL